MIRSTSLPKRQGLQGTFVLAGRTCVPEGVNSSGADAKNSIPVRYARRRPYALNGRWAKVRLTARSDICAPSGRYGYFECEGN
jgi:hypothetical protein